MINNSKKGFVAIIIAIVAAILVIGGVVYYAKQSQEQEDKIAEKEKALMQKEAMEQNEKNVMQKETTEQQEKNVMMEEKIDKINNEVYSHIGQLKNVAAGKTILGIKFYDNTSGIIKARFKDGTYNLLATFNDLPDPKNSDFYEGWVIRKSLLYSVKSVGKVKKIDGFYINEYSSATDLTDHDYYVLTLEPDDNNPASAYHILEGELIKK
jgi:hypothetical protein